MKKVKYTIKYLKKHPKNKNKIKKTSELGFSNLKQAKLSNLQNC